VRIEEKEEEEEEETHARRTLLPNRPFWIKWI
jgi:hypothetical protein